eukprot:Unigene15160_Nuclearia_a/m.45391 Unigene15160_Nuclearia_a/g.45391  ORF Unigene15160_Nuclearia_a/g.45391 Unigene15160_Nuclearia_a/m.45391 type:complete len:389 (+) Unigene15160_Nuclearia_a:219-1385(+)
MRILWPLLSQSMPVLLAGSTGLLLAGFALDSIKDWAVFGRRAHLVVLVPMLLGLKCNLEMTLASRLSTAYHLGHLGSSFFSRTNSVLYANLGVVQIQALVISIVATALVTLIALVEGVPLGVPDGTVVFATAFITAWTTAVLLALFTAGVMYISAKRSLNPDNISGPLVASLGDLVATVIMALVAVLIDSLPPLVTMLVLLVFAAVMVPMAMRLTAMHNDTSRVLIDGWQPLLLGLGISSAAGALLGSSIERLDGGITVLLPVINGVGGNIAGIFASRTASSLHKREKRDRSRSVELSLLLLTVPTHTVFLCVMWLLMAHERVFSLLFVALFLGAALCQVALLLFLAEIFADRAWRAGQDPDNHVVPYLTALGDALGTLSLVAISYAA